MLTHPNIWKFNAILSAIAATLLYIAYQNGNMQQMAFNGFFLAVNLVGAVGNYLLRSYRQSVLDQQEIEQRQHLIRSTIGE